MPTPDWLTARPIAHRGLHDEAGGVIENTPSAFRAAVAGRYAIECDLQISADGEAMVHHDDTLDRLTEGTGRLDARSAADLQRVAFKATADRMLTLGELCDLVAGQVTLVIELKANFDDNRRLAERAAKVLSAYAGPVAVMSFDPGPMAVVRTCAPGLCRGLVAQRHDPADPEIKSRTVRYVRQALAARLQFLAYRVQDLSSPFPRFARAVLGLPLLTWTVRSAEDRAEAKARADQMIFEGFRP